MQSNMLVQLDGAIVARVQELGGGFTVDGGEKLIHNVGCALDIQGANYSLVYKTLIDLTRRGAVRCVEEREVYFDRNSEEVPGPQRVTRTYTLIE